MARNLGPSSLLEELPTEEELKRQRREGLSRSSLLAELPPQAEIQPSAPPSAPPEFRSWTEAESEAFELESMVPLRPPEHGVRVLPARPAAPMEAEPTGLGRMGAAAQRAAQEALFAPPMVPTPIPKAESVAEQILAPAATVVAGAAQAAELFLKPVSMLFQGGKAAVAQGMRELGLGELDIQSAERDMDALLNSWIATRLGAVRHVPGRPGAIRAPATMEEFRAIVDDFGGKAAREALRSINDPAFKAKAMDYLRQKFTVGVEQARGAGATERGLALPPPPEAPRAAPVRPRPVPEAPAPEAVEVQPQAVVTPSGTG